MKRNILTSSIITILISLFCLYIFLTLKKNSLFYINKPERWDLFLPLLFLGFITIALIIFWTIKIVTHFNFIILLLMFFLLLIIFSISKALNINLTEFQNELLNIIVLISTALIGNIFCAIYIIFKATNTAFQLTKDHKFKN